MAIRIFPSFSTLTPVAALLLTLAGGLHAPIASADTTDLSPTPPDITTTVDPNIVVSFDDSGSMLATAMPDAISGSGHFDEEYYYSSTTNVIYYNPNITYWPPLQPDGTSFPDSDYDHAWRDGLCANWPGTYCYGDANYRDLSDQFDQDFNNITSTSNTANSNNTTWDNIPGEIRGSGYHGGFYFDCPSVGSNWGCDRVEMNSATDEQKRNFANWYSYYRTRNLMTRTAMSRAFGVLGENYRVAWQTINDFPLTASDEIRRIAGDTADSWRHRFFTFLYDVHSNGSTPNRRATLRAGHFFERGASESYLDPFWNGQPGEDSARLSCRQNYHMLVTDGYWNWNSNPSLPDPFWDSETNGSLPDGRDFSTSDEESSIIWNVDGSKYSSSLANIAFHYWANDLQPTLADEVPAYLPDLATDVFDDAVDPASDGDDTSTSQTDLLNNKEIYWNPNNDPATWQHMVNFMITLGVAGEREFPGDYDALRDGSLEWPRPANNSPEAVDDTWHAAINSRGQYFSASDPDTLVQKLVQILGSINNRTGATTAGSLSSAVLTTGAYSYSANYKAATWSGDLIAQPVRSDGSLGPNVWSAAAKLGDVDPSESGRLVFTSKMVGGELIGNSFSWDDLDATEQTWLNTDDSTGTVDSLGADRLAWLRGDDSDEGTLFRTRSSKLGAIINSQPVFVSYPAFGYSNYFPDMENGDPAPEVAAFEDDADDCADSDSCDTYEQFVRNHADRTPVAYVGANDGMLHVFDVSVNENDGGTPEDPSDDTVTQDPNAGEELWAFVPRTVFPKLASQTAKVNFTFRPTVDGPITVRDVFYGGAWHTILVGSLRLGGRGVYALDITNPDLAETDAGNMFLWEFNAQSDGADAANPSTADNPANLGFTYGQPAIGRLHSGKWAVLVPGGYFPDCDATGAMQPCDDSMAAADNEFSSLFVLDAETGDLIKELRTPTGVTSYGLASPVLGDYNSDQVADVAFAGDLLGNMWRFDLSDESPASWSVSQVFAPAVAEEQPITTMPRLFPDPASTGFIVVFGTGKYLGLEDRTNDIPTQYMYGVREMGPQPDAVPVTYTRDDLVEQELYQETVTMSGENTIVRGVSNNAVGYDTGGWYIALDVSLGERVVATPSALFNTNRIIMPSLIPGGTDPCHPERDGAIMVLDALTGGSGEGLSVPENPGGWPDGVNVVGARVSNPPIGGTLPVATQIGGGKLYLPGIVIDNGTEGGQTFSIDDAIWRRRSWSVLQ